MKLNGRFIYEIQDMTHASYQLLYVLTSHRLSLIYRPIIILPFYSHSKTKISIYLAVDSKISNKRVDDV